MIETEDLCVRLGDTEVLRRVSMRVARGGFLTVVGPNGAGKSTLLRCLDGIIRPSSGEVSIDGRSLARYGRRQLARTVSYVPQPDGALLEFTVRSFVEMGRFPHLGAWAAPTAADVDAVREAMELTEVGALAERTVASLSGGERQRASIAAALAQGGSVLLLDEPTSFLDYRHQGQVLDLVDRLHRERGLTVVAVTHDLNSTVPSADAVIALKDGRVVFEGRPADLLREDALAAIYDADFRLVAGGHRGLPIVQPARSGS
ncbi:MAG TPA: ABC transporter ATP-binding protein [Candidatus Sulfomarinibacteraceae bacterium]|nr:ABC transporter ATP-binding protein [Candidatus Sulfomarinibacteraceae bacterium]